MGKSSSAKMQVVEYRMSMHVGVAMSLDAVTEIRVDERVAWSGDLTSNTALHINRPDLFGGQKKEGGLVGTIQVLLGKDDQVLPAAAAARYGKAPTDCPAFRGLTTLMFHGNTVISTGRPLEWDEGLDMPERFSASGGFMWKMNSPVIAQKIEVTGRRAPKGLNPDLAMVGPDANPAAMIYECLVNDEWGMSGSPLLIDTAAFEAAAETLQDEEFGLSVVWMRQTTIEAFVTEILDHIQATLFMNPNTGLMSIKLLRDDYDIETLRHITPDNAALSNFRRRSGEIANELTVTWTNPETEQEESLTAQDIASIQSQGGEKVSASRNYYMIRNRELGAKVLARDLRESTAPIVTLDATLDRSAWDLLPGEVVRVSWPERSIHEIVARVGRVDLGKPGSSTVKAPLSQDIFSLARPPIAIPPPSEWVDPTSDPAPLDMQLFTAPSYFLRNGELQREPVTLDDSEALIGVLADSQTYDSFDYELVSESLAADGSTVVTSKGDMTLTPRVSLISALSATATSLLPPEMFPVIDETPRVGGFVFLGYGDTNQEIALVTAVSSSGWTIARGVLDTVPRTWSAGTPVWLVNPGARIVDSQTLHAVTGTATYRGLDRTARGSLAYADAPSESATVGARPHLPLRPANVRIGSVGHSGSVDVSAMSTITVNWATRNRLLEDTQVLRWTDGAIPPEYRQRTILLFTTPGGAQVARYEHLWTESVFAFPKSWFARYSTLHLDVFAERDGLVSMVTQRLTLTGLPNNPTADPPPPAPVPEPPPPPILAPAFGVFTAEGGQVLPTEVIADPEEPEEVAAQAAIPAIFVTAEVPDWRGDNPDARSALIQYSRVDPDPEEGPPPPPVWVSHAPVELTDYDLRVAITNVAPLQEYRVRVAYIVDGIVGVFRSLANVTTGQSVAGDTATVGGRPVGEVTAQIDATQEAVEALEETYGDTASAAASAAAAALSAAASETARANAVIAQGAAATSAADALEDALAAAASQVAAQSAYTSAVLTGGNMDFAQGTDGWTNNQAGVLNGVPMAANQWSAQAGYEGRAGVIVTATAAGIAPARRDIWSRRLWAVDPARKYRIRTRFFIGAGTGNVRMYVGHQQRDAARATVGGNSGYRYSCVGGKLYPAGAGWVEATSPVITGTAVSDAYAFDAGTTQIGLIAWVNYDNNATTVCAFDEIVLLDVTEVEAAAGSASAAATSASSAATSATNAGTSAAAANTARTQAETARGQAQTAATQASDARDDAEGAAASASTSAGAAAGSATAAGGSATAAAGSASTAATHATNAGNSATAAAASAVTAASARDDATDAATAAAGSAASASTSATQAGSFASAADTARTQAETARGQAQTFANNASNSATTASAAASTATTQAGLAATARDTAEGHATAASTSATTASGYADDAETAAAAATSARITAEAARDTAGGHATAASGSASSASASASDAAASASAASTSQTQAETARSQAQTAATQAASARDTAEGHAASASTSAGAAATSASAAGSSASAAAGSASSASTSASNAAASASAADASRVAAEAALSSQGRSNLVARNSITNAGQLIDLGWGLSGWGVRMIGAGANMARSFVLGPLLQNAAYSVSFKAKLTEGTSQVINIDLFPDTLPETTRTITTTEQTFTWNGLTSAHADMTGSVNLRFFRNPLPSGVTVEITDIKFEQGATATAWTPSPRDARDYAGAAATSASSASASSTAAGASATAASGSATTATTQAGNAATYAGQSSTARDEAVTARNDAQTAASTAGGHATTASTAASTATTQAAAASASATLAAAFNRPGANLVRNSTGVYATTGWTAAGAWGALNDLTYGPRFETTGTGTNAIAQTSAEYIPVTAGEWVTFQADLMRRGATGGGVHVRLGWYDGSKAQLSSPNNWTLRLSATANREYGEVLSREAQAPAGAAFCRVQIFIEDVSSATAHGARRVKVERGRLPATGWSDDQTDVLAAASITSTASVAAGADGIARALIGLLLDVNGYVSGMRSENDGSTASVKFLADVFEIVSPGGGARAEYSNGIWYFYDATNTTRVSIGKPHGGSSHGLVLWCGPASVTKGTEMKGDAYVYVSMNETGGGRFGGSAVPTGGGGQGPGGSVESGSWTSALIADGTWTTIAAKTMPVVPGGGYVQFDGFPGLPTVSAGTFNGEIRVIQTSGGAVIAGPQAFSCTNGSPIDPSLSLGGSAVATGSVGYSIQVRRASGSNTLTFSGNYNLSALLIGSPTQVGFLSPELAGLIATAVQPADLTSALAGKANSSHTHAAADITSGTLADARIPALAISKTTGLQGALDGKAASSHTHAAADITSGTLADARIPALAISKTTGLQTALDAKLTNTSSVIATYADRIHVGNTGSHGYIRLVRDASRTGYVTGYSTGGTRMWYVGYANATQVVLTGESTITTFVCNKAFQAVSLAESSDPLLKINLEYISDDAQALIDVCMSGRMTWTSIEDGRDRMGFNAEGLREIDPRWVEGGTAVTTVPVFVPAEPEEGEEPEPLPEGVVWDEDEQAWLDPRGLVFDPDMDGWRTPYRIAPTAMLSSAFAAIRQLANDNGALEAVVTSQAARIETLEAHLAGVLAHLNL